MATEEKYYKCSYCGTIFGPGISGLDEAHECEMDHVDIDEYQGVELMYFNKSKYPKKITIEFINGARVTYWHSPDY